jgi:hypothetical protein
MQYEYRSLHVRPVSYQQMPLPHHCMRLPAAARATCNLESWQLSCETSVQDGVVMQPVKPCVWPCVCTMSSCVPAGAHRHRKAQVCHHLRGISCTPCHQCQVIDILATIHA